MSEIGIEDIRTAFALEIGPPDPEFSRESLANWLDYCASPPFAFEPCPCGNETPSLTSDPIYPPLLFAIHCRQCGRSTDREGSELDAVEAWNDGETKL